MLHDLAKAIIGVDCPDQTEYVRGNLIGHIALIDKVKFTKTVMELALMTLVKKWHFTPCDSQPLILA